MIRPMAFGYNYETAATNVFQQSPSHGPIASKAILEFNHAVQLLQEAHIRVHVFNDTAEPIKPDAVFPNNWLSTHQQGTAVLYPMCAPNRRAERSLEILAILAPELALKKIIDLRKHETEGHFLEGTGSLVLDRVNGLAYACLSERTHQTVLHEFCVQANYRPITFRAKTTDGTPVYHTNVVMSIGERFAVACLDAIVDPKERINVFDQLVDSGKDVIPISMNQLHCFAGNMIQLKNTDDERKIVLSQTAFKSLSEKQIHRLENHGGLVTLPIPTIERVGGGSARCMIAELFLPQKM